MVVDDSRLAQVKMEDVLKGTDYEIAARCHSGEDAIAQYAAVQPDLVTMDIIMQGMDGWTGCRGDHPEKASGRENCDGLLSGLQGYV